MDYNGIFTYYKAIIISVIASVTDITLMYELDMNTKINESLIIGLSSFAGLLIQFFGQKFWTFKNMTKNRKELIRQVLLFFGLEISLILCVIFIYNTIRGDMEKYVKKIATKYKNNRIIKVFVKNKGGEQVVTPIGNVLLKSVIVFLTFNIISFPMWKYVIFKKNK